MTQQVHAIIINLNIVRSDQRLKAINLNVKLSYII